MNDLISREEVLKLPQRKGYAVNGWETYIRVSDIKELPSVYPNKDLIHLQKEQAYMQGYEDGQKPRQGKWIDSGYGVECSLCGEWYPHASIARNQLNFCPNCGADMRGEHDESIITT